MTKTNGKIESAATYCLTGSFVSGSRRDVAAVLEHLGHRVVEDLSGQVDFLLIGSETAAGNQHIQDALGFLYKGYRITLLHEGHWLNWVVSNADALSLLNQAADLEDASVFKRAPSKAKGVLWEGAHLIRLRYRNAKGEESEREVRLQKVTGEVDGTPASLVGYCMLRKMNRTFKAANVASVELIGDDGDQALQLVLARI